MAKSGYGGRASGVPKAAFGNKGKPNTNRGGVMGKLSAPMPAK